MSLIFAATPQAVEIIPEIPSRIPDLAATSPDSGFLTLNGSKGSKHPEDQMPGKMVLNAAMAFAGPI